MGASTKENPNHICPEKMLSESSLLELLDNLSKRFLILAKLSNAVSAFLGATAMAHRIYCGNSFDSLYLGHPNIGPSRIQLIAWGQEFLTRKILFDESPWTKGAYSKAEYTHLLEKRNQCRASLGNILKNLSKNKDN